MPTTYLPHDDHVARYVKPKFLGRDENGRVTLIHPDAFMLRPATDTIEAEKFLSVDWMEHYQGDRVKQLRSVRGNMELKPDKKGRDAYGVIQVRLVSDACTRHGAKVRILHEPNEKNPAHSAIRQYPRDNHQLATELANLASGDLTPLSDILP